MRTYPDNRYLLLLLSFVALVMFWSVVQPKDLYTWFLEVFPIFIGLPILFFTRNRMPLTTFTYTVISLHCCILMVGGHYTYAEVPLGEWFKDWFGFTRNHYDRIGHFAQGFVPALIAREIYLRKTSMHPGGYLTLTVAAIPLAVSLLYELLEFGVAIASGAASDAFLGTQGDIWDTQKDMLQASIGMIAAQLFCSRYQNRVVVRELMK